MGAEGSQLEHRGARAVGRMVEFAPATGGLALWAAHHDVDGAAAPDAPPISTDGRTIFYGAGFEALDSATQIGWVAHAVLHIALRHVQRHADLQRLTGDADLRLFNLCADAIVNSAIGHLGWLKLPDRAVTLEALLASALDLHQAAETALLEWDVESLYRAIDDRSSDDGQPRRDGPRAARVRALGAGQLADLRPDTGTPALPEAEAEAARDWQQRLLRAHASDGAFSMLRALLADLPRSHTPWQHLLRVQLARGLAQRPALSWSRPARSYLANQGRAGRGHRMPWEPGTTASQRVPRLAVVVDVSGSIEAALLDRFARELDAITRRLGSAVVLVVGDDQVRSVLHCAPGSSGLRDIVFGGGGGTDFTPLLEEADRHRPDIGVVLTDLEGPARFRPAWPVLWAVTAQHAQARPPFGRLLVLR